MEKFIELVEKFFYYIKWPYFIGYTLAYNYIETHLALDLLWAFFAILIIQDLYKKFQEDKKRKAQEEKEAQAKKEVELNEIIENSSKE